MRIFLWLMLITSFLSADVQYVIQVLSEQQKSSVTPEFMAKVSAMKMGRTVKYIDGKYTVFVGDFQSEAEASAHLSEVQEKVNPEAFVTTITKEPELNPEAKMQQMMVMAQAKLLQASKQEEAAAKGDKTSGTEEKTVDTVDVLGPQDKPVSTKAKRVLAIKEARKTEKAFSEETSQSLFCKPTKKALREAEISEALSFYKNSSYYRFDQGL